MKLKRLHYSTNTLMIKTTEGLYINIHEAAW